MILLYLKSKNYAFLFLLTLTKHPLICTALKNFNDFFWMSGWSINPGIWLGKRICSDNLEQKKYVLALFFSIFHSMLFSVKLELSAILRAHVELWIYLGMPEHLMRNIRLDVFLFWSSVQRQTINEISSFNLIDLLSATTPEKEFSQIWCLYRTITVLSKNWQFF